MTRTRLSPPWIRASLCLTATSLFLSVDSAQAPLAPESTPAAPLVVLPSPPVASPQTFETVWNNGLFIRTKDNDFSAHVGGVLHLHGAWYSGGGDLQTLPGSISALELGLRYSYANLTDGPIRGGRLNGVTLGLNRYWNPNMKMQFKYDYCHRDESGNAATNGSIHGFVTRLAWDFQRRRSIRKSLSPIHHSLRMIG